VVLVSVPDREIRRAYRRLHRAGLLLRGQVVLHASGCLPSSLMDMPGPHRGSFHPMRPLPAIPAPDEFSGTTISVEGDARAVRASRALARALGARVVVVQARLKPLYHAAAVLGSNCLTALLSAACSALVRSGLKRQQALSALVFLSRATVEAVEREGPEAALTGPVLRGDVEVVERNLAALDSVDRDLAAAYASLSLLALRTARCRGLPADLESRLQEALGRRPSSGGPRLPPGG
jgi:predicted short-subunit dehydrogenase-like oxidoreductase (DUF2520 family)